MSRYGVLLKLTSYVLVILFFISFNIDSKKALDNITEESEKDGYTYTQSQKQIIDEVTVLEDNHNPETDISNQKQSVPLTHTFVKIFGSFWTILLAFILRITGSILTPMRIS